MNIKKRFFVLLFISIFLGIFAFQTKPTKASSTPTPTIIEAGVKRVSAVENRLYLIGLTNSGTEVLIYVNGEFAGMAKVSSKGTETDSFYYQTEQLFPEGDHNVLALARKKTSMILSSPVQTKIVVSAFLPAPTLIKPTEKEAIGKPKPFIAGLTASKTFVHIYINGVYNGKTDNLVHKSGTANFAYSPFLNLEKGNYEVWAIAEDENGRKSEFSNILKFKIEDPMPAPTMLKPVVNHASSKQQPFIVGLAKNDSVIKVFIDNKFDGHLLVKNHESGTANFAYKPSKPLTQKDHIIHSSAADSRGKESILSNIVNYDLSAEENYLEEVLGEKTTKEEIEESPVDIINSSGEELTEKIDEAGLATEESSAETETEKTNFKTEIIIFALFVLGIIIWIIWANKELIKTKNGKKDEKTEENKDSTEKNQNNSK